MDWNRDHSNTFSAKLQGAMESRKFLSNTYFDKLYTNREGIVNRIKTKRRSLGRLQLRRASKDESSNVIQNNKAPMRRRFSTGNAYQLTQIDLEESGYLEGLAEVNTTEATANGHTSDNHLSDENAGEILNAQEDSKEEVIEKSDDSSEEATEDGMNNMSKKLLTLSVSSSICSEESSVEGDLSYDHSRLTTVLGSIDPKRLHNYLKRKLEQKDSTTIHALGTLLPKKRFKGETLHCVRCHKEYDPKHGEKTCVLNHQKDDVMTISEDEVGADFACERCGSVFRIDGKWKYKESLNGKYDCGACFAGLHTISTDEVVQEQNGISKSCEDYGCIVFYV